MGRRVLELGAGTGALGIAVAALGGDVVITDLPDVVPLTRKNVEANAASFSGRGSAHVVRAPPPSPAPGQYDPLHYDIYDYGPLVKLVMVLNHVPWFRARQRAPLSAACQAV